MTRLGRGDGQPTSSTILPVPPLEAAAHVRATPSRLTLRIALTIVLLLGVVVRGSVVLWDFPWEPHHPDEHILPLEAVALWEGVTPREVGWPASTTRLLLSAVSAGKWIAEQGTVAWRSRSQPERVLTTVTGWIGAQYVDPSSLYRLGRTVSMLTGVLQLIALAWILRGWVGPIGVVVGTCAVAVSPMAVLHSQYVLADIAGVLFATMAMGRNQRPEPWRVVAMAVCAGLAATSKFHFGLWVLTPVLAVWLARGSTGRPGKWTLTVLGSAVFLWTVVTLFPWAWTNPVLALKEFLGVVAIKVGTAPASPGQFLSNLALLFSSEGALLWAGALLGCMFLRRDDWRRLAPIAVPVALGAVILARSAIVFERYSLVMLPGLAVLAAVGWERALAATHRPLRLGMIALLVVATTSTFVSLLSAERAAGEADVDVLVRQWVLAHVPRGTRIAIHDENNALLPRSAAQLRACSTDNESSDGYQKKWQTLGLAAPPEGVEPMRSMLMNDEFAYAYWCRRELQAQRDPGFFVVRYHNDLRSNAVLERDAIAEFLTGTTTASGGIDVLVVNRPIAAGRDPVQVMTTRGVRLIYQR